MKRSKPISIKISKAAMKDAENLNVFIVDKEGQVVEKVPLKSGETKLKSLASEVHANSKVFIAGEIPKEIDEGQINEKLLMKIGAFQPTLEISPTNVLEIPFIPQIPFPFPFKWCNITGQLSKNFIIDGVSQKLPVCNARVHICEVDPINIFQPIIPDRIILDLRDRLRDIVRIPKPFPLPDPSPVIFRSKLNFGRPIPEINPIFTQRNLDLKLELPTKIKAELFSPELSIVKQSIFKNFQLFHPWICLWPLYWPYFYKCDELAVVKPDCNGRFNAHTFYPTLGDKPDIYIWVEIFDGNNWVTVYRPPIACNTRWNYTCGSDININITDARVSPCNCEPLEGSIIWMKKVNRGVTIRSIQQSNNPSGHLSNAVGLTNFASSNISPFGASFPFVVQFGSGFPGGGVTHYRWSYRKLKSEKLQNVVDTYHPMQGVVGKPYRYPTSSTSGPLVGVGSFSLGPSYDNELPKYKIPKVDANAEVAEPNSIWSEADTNTINVISPSFTNGLYEFKFELINNAGNIVPVNANTYLVDRKSGDPDGPASITADGLPESYVMKDLAEKAIAFRFKMRIDNDICYADVQDALVAGSPTDPTCGIGTYNSGAEQISFNYLAGHPQDFATYKFEVTRGNSISVETENTLSADVGSDPDLTVSQVTDSGELKDRFVKRRTISEINGSCDQVAFAQELDVTVTHTNGNSRLSGYDRSDTAAIAIEKVVSPATP